MVEWTRQIVNVYKTVNTVPSAIAGLSSEQLGNIADFARDPRGFVLGIIVLWIVEQIFAFTTAILEQILQVFDLLATVPAMLAQPFTLIGDAIGSTLLAGVSGLTELVVSTVALAGPFAPLVAALLLVAVVWAVETFGPPLANAATDLLGAIPVVGSVLDFLATFVIGVLGRLGGDE